METLEKACHPAPVTPTDRAPSADAPVEVRSEWCRTRVERFIERTPNQGAMPDDVRPTHRWEVEFNGCVIDPEKYERDTQHELKLTR